MPPLTELVRERIAADGPVAFQDFMELALYHPEHGYYAQPGFTTGTRGDFATSPDAGALFGATLAGAAEAFAQQPGRLVEVGPGSGRLVADVLDHLSAEALSRLEVILVDPFERRHEQLSEVLSSRTDSGRVVQTIEQVPPGRSLILMNEVFDALPVHPVRRTEDGWELLQVDVDDRGLARVWGPCPDPVSTLAAEHAGALPVGHRYEVNTQALGMLDDLARLADPGAILAFDYGGRFQDLWPQRPEGTLRGFRGHRHADVLDAPGRTDITYDVDFTMLQAEAGKRGLETAAYGAQERLLVHLGVAQRARETGAVGTLKQLVVPGAFAGRFQALVLDRGGVAAEAGLEVDLDDPELWMQAARGGFQDEPLG